MRGIVLFTLFSAIFFSCGGPSTPKGVAEKFLQAMSNEKYEAAQNFATGKGKANIELWKLSKTNTIDAVKDINCTETGDTAICTFCCSNTLNKITLVKDEISKRWLVNFVVPAAPIDTVVKADSVATEIIDTVITKKEEKLSDELDDFEAMLDE